jgi:hypothetical protein
MMNINLAFVFFLVSENSTFVPYEAAAAQG